MSSHPPVDGRQRYRYRQLTEVLEELAGEAGVRSLLGPQPTVSSLQDAPGLDVQDDGPSRDPEQSSAQVGAVRAVAAAVSLALPAVVSSATIWVNLGCSRPETRNVQR